MRRRMNGLLAIWPALLVAATAFGGGLLSATHAPQAALGQLAILLLALPGALELADPWRLGARVRWLPAVLLVAVAGSWWLSDLPRAGKVGVALLPALLLAPAAVARTLSSAEQRRRAVTAWGLAVALVAAVALVEVVRHGGRAAAPLGHHNLLGVWLATTLPVAAIGWRERGFRRVIAGAALVSGLAALAATRSLTAGLALAVVALWLRGRTRRGREVLLGIGLLAAGLAWPRLERVVSGDDSSMAARGVYAKAAWRGALEKPWTGWGPGSLPWTIAGFVEPVPGVNPPGELVGDPHSTPLTLALELGLPAAALALAVVVVFVWRRWRRWPLAADPPVALGGLAGGAIAALAALGGSWLSVPALPIAVVVVAGFALAGEGRGPRPSRAAASVQWALVVAYVGLAAAWLLPTVRAHLAYEKAVKSADPELRSSEIGLAARLDPAFPLYAARRAWPLAPPKKAGWLQAIEAAKRARGAGPLWLRAGVMSLEARQWSAATEALHRAMLLDPLSAAAPFLLFEASRGKEIDCAARALLAEPKLAAAAVFRGREPLRRAIIDRARRWPGIDAGWRRELTRQAVAASPRGRGDTDLVIRMDRVPALSASVYLFRRSPWPGELARIRLDLTAAGQLRLPAASELKSSSRDAFPRLTCAPAPAGGRPEKPD